MLKAGLNRAWGAEAGGGSRKGRITCLLHLGLSLTIGPRPSSQPSPVIPGLTGSLKTTATDLLPAVLRNSGLRQ